MDPLTLSLIIGGVSALAQGGGALLSSQKQQRASAIEQANYANQQNVLNAEKYRDPLSSVSNKALLKQLDERIDKTSEALENRAIAGGATFENSLAAKQASNQAISDTVSSMMQGEEARKASYTNSLLQLDTQHAANQIAQQQAAAQNWANWGNAMAGSVQNLGATYLLGGK